MISSSGRAPDLHSGGGWFESSILHQSVLLSTIMNKKLIKQIGNPLGWLFVILVVCLLYIISNNSKTIADLENEIQLGELNRSAMADELAVRDDALTGMKSEIDMLDNMLGRLKAESEANYNAYVEIKEMSESQNNDLDNAFELISNLKQELSDTQTLLNVCTTAQTQ